MTTTHSLFDGHEIGGLALPNRVVMAPMSRVRGTAEGLATDAMATYFAQHASAGLLISDGVGPNRVGTSNPGAAGLRDDAEAASWRPVTDAVHAAGGRIFAQLMHGGRIGHESVSGLQPVGPSAVAANAPLFTLSGPKQAPVPRALSTDEVGEQARSYAEAAVRGVDAGFDGVELHGANGYLISQFLSSNANLRTDSPQLYDTLLGELDRLGLAYVHLEPTTDEATMVALRRRWSGTFMVNPSTWLQRGASPYGPVATNREIAEHWLGLGADLVSFGRAFIANPDLVDRLRLGLPLAEADPATFYGGGEEGFTDFPAYRHTA